MTEIKKIGIVTSGGDCGGLNAVIKGAASMGHELGVETVIIPNGYAGLYNLDDFGVDSLVSLTIERSDLIHSFRAGSEAGNSRVKIKKIDDPDKYQRIDQGLKKHSIDALIVGGGDDSGNVAHDLAENNFPVIHAPKTMDMDLHPYSVGADSVFNKIAQQLADVRTTGETHNRVLVVDVFGRYVGHSAFRGGIAGDADAILIPEIAPDFDIVYEHLFEKYTQRIINSDVNQGTYIIVTSEALKGDPSRDEVNEEGFLVDKSQGQDSHGHYKLAGAGKRVVSEIQKRMKEDSKMQEFMEHAGMYVKGQYEIPEVRAIVPGHLVRCGSSTAYDVNFGKEAGAGATILLQRGITGKTVTGFQNNEVSYMAIEKAIERRPVDLGQLALHEAMGVCFGRKPGFNAGKIGLKEVSGVARHL